MPVPGVPAAPGPGTIQAEWARLRSDVRAGGFHRRPTARVLLELAFALSVAVAGLLAYLASPHPALRALAVLAGAWGAVAIGTNTHTSSHHATSDRRWLNELLTYFGFPFCLQYSATFWWRKHVALHHPAPNVVGRDEDADLQPWLAFTRPEVERASGLRRLYYRCQWPFALVLLAGIHLNMMLAGWRFLCGRLREPGERRRAHLYDLAALLLFWAAWVGAPMAFFPAADVLSFFAWRTALVGYGLFAVLAPGHFPAEAAVLTTEAADEDFLRLQTATTVDFRTGPLGRLLCAGLEYQIEHHLFPGLSHVHYPRVSGLVREFCRRNGLPYRSLGWGEAVWKSFLVFVRPKPVEHRAPLTGREGA
ncbi:MAG TPA: acyl-CoA desaturase [Vicinamibacteria bacterium]|nr:acyl-CoA desaturase [Vicinamibacteria bacterium]